MVLVSITRIMTGYGVGGPLNGTTTIKYNGTTSACFSGPSSVGKSQKKSENVGLNVEGP